MIDSLVKFINTKDRLKLISEFWSNIAVAWFIAAFINEGNLLTKIIYIASMIFSLSLALIFRK